MATDTEQHEQATTPALAVGGVVVAGVVVAGLLLALVDNAIPRSVWHDPLLWSISSAVAVATQATAWTRSPRVLSPVGLLLVGAAYGTNQMTRLAFLSETPLVWITGVVCMITGVIWHLRRPA